MGMRDIIAHHYFDIDAVIVFDVMKNNLPAIKMTIDKMLFETPSVSDTVDEDKKLFTPG